METEEVVRASMRLLEFVPKVGTLIQQFRARTLDSRESLQFAKGALLLRYPSVAEAPIEAETLLRARRSDDEGTDLWNTLSRVQENLTCGGVSDCRRDRRGRLRSVRALRGIDSKVSVNQALWNLAEHVASGEPVPTQEGIAVMA